MAGAPVSCSGKIFWFLKSHQEFSQPVETRTEGKTAEELISLISKSAHAGTEENVLGPGNCQNMADDHQPQDNLWD